MRDIDRREYQVALEARDDGRMVCECDCDSISARKICAHVVAATQHLIELLQKESSRAWETRLLPALTPPTTAGPRRVSPQIPLFSLSRPATTWHLHAYAIARSRVPTTVDTTDAAAIGAALRESGDLTIGRPLHEVTANRFPDVDPEILQAARLVVLFHHSYYYGDEKAALFDAALERIAHAPVFLADESDPLATPLRLVPHGGALEIHLESTDDGGLTLLPRLAVPDEPAHTLRQLTLVLQSPLWVLADGLLARVPATPVTLLNALASGPIRIPAADAPYFRATYLAPLAEQVALAGDSHFGAPIVDTPPLPRLYLSEGEGDTLNIALRFGYGPVEVPAERLPRPIAVVADTASGLLHRVERRLDDERELADSLPTRGLMRGADSGGGFVLRTRNEIAPFLIETVPALVADGWEVYGEDALRTHRINRATPTLAWNVSSGIDWFDVQVLAQFGDTTASLAELRRSLRRKERYVRLADGSLGMLPEEWLERFRSVLAVGEEKEGALRLSPLHALLLEQAITDADGQSVVDEEFGRRKEALRDFERIEERPVPQSFLGTLRPYQKAGYDWLHFLRDHGFGGCLADDMGTGKTAQALALLESVKDDSPHASLLVVPRSLVINWEREAARFTPNLRVLRYDDATRSQVLTQFDSADLVITTYGILLRDIEKLRAYPFHYAILDEAQAIKNPLAQTARAARLLTPRHRLSLTGTPIENGVVELWSQFAFLNPGLLGGFEPFKESFLAPIERGDDATATASLRALVKPFLLRRTKDQVARDLPPRQERVQWVEMEPAQRRLYERTRDEYRSRILGISDGPTTKTRFTVLEGLLRLRQIACHPHLVDPSTTARSAKLEAVVETLQTLREEGHKALVFSQFVQLLTLLRKDLEALNIPHLNLDGRTRDRQARIDAFQNDPSIPFFLISLKAGGVGLNLTAADYVLHLDPWWNPAVEQQATDRTHRIGQDKPVFVTRYIARDTVEEKIQTLQERKRQLVGQLIQNETSLFKALTRDDIDALFT